MSRRRKTVDDWTLLSANRGSEDGVDPRDFHAKRPNASKRMRRKGLQLCRQVRDALHLALSASADAVLQCVSLLAVEPAPHSGRLRVVVGADDRAAALSALERAAGHLRNEVAWAINRRHTPELVFEVVASNRTAGDQTAFPFSR